MYVTISAAHSAYKDVEDTFNDFPQGSANRALEVSVDGGTTYSTSVVVAFDSEAAAGQNAWDSIRDIKVRAIDDDTHEGERTVIISHSSHAIYKANPDSLNLTFDSADIPNVEVRLIDDDLPAVVIYQSGFDTSTVENGTTDDYRIKLTRQPAANETVTVKFDYDASQLALTSSEAGTRFATHGDGTASLTFDDQNYQTPITIDVQAIDDSLLENTMQRLVVHTLDGTDVYNGSVSETEVAVTIKDNDTGGVIVTESGGSTVVSVSNSDTYTLALTKAPQAAEVVSIQILTDGQTLVEQDDPSDGRFVTKQDGTVYVEFDNTNWNVPFDVKVTGLPDGSVLDEQPLQTFAAQPHLLTKIGGPLYLEGSTIPTKDRTLTTQIFLPTESDTTRPSITVDVNEDEQTDTLNVFNDGSVEDNTDGINRSVSQSTQSGLLAIYEVDGLADPDMPAIETFANLSGLGMTPGGELTLDFGSYGQEDLRTFDTGITYHSFEFIDVMLGQGNDTFVVDGNAEDALTVIHGGGNTSIGNTPGGDTITVLAGGGPQSPLVLFGDTGQDGLQYSLTTSKIAAGDFSGTAREFSEFGDDLIDLSGASGGVVAYGGPGDDVIIGSDYADQLAGGSGADTIDGMAGGDHIYGDSGFNIDV